MKTMRYIIKDIYLYMSKRDIKSIILDKDTLKMTYDSGYTLTMSEDELAYIIGD